MTERSPRSADIGPEASEPAGRFWTRRRALVAGLGSVAAIAAAGATSIELAGRGVLPGQQYLDSLDGACQVYVPSLTFGPPGPQRSGTFYSGARHRIVGYTVAYPPGHLPGARLPLVIALHG